MCTTERVYESDITILESYGKTTNFHTEAICFGEIMSKKFLRLSKSENNTQ
jgi:hypothetical protein